jgi:hypothetical protein|tara:strand:- start:445 stop:1083 length:639 start_codon:yes stop_codon:yes gene_type:complete
MKWDDWDDFNYDNMAHELEVHIITTDGAQHLRLNGYLKRNSVLIKSEVIADNKKENIFGRFMIYPTHKQLESLKKENRKNDLYSELEIMTTDGRWDLYKKDKEYFTPKDNIQRLDEGIKEFLFNISLQTPRDITKWVEKANEVSIDLFKQSKSYQDEYVETNDMTYEDKIKDIDVMINYFEEREQYEDCALLMKIKKRIKQRKQNLKIQKNE